jgi:photosystem II stability/assembly factor-like uncharacterized protein
MGGPDVTKPLVVSSFAWNPENTNHVYMATNQGLYRSIDAGKSWKKLTNGLPNQAVSEVIAVSDAPWKLYAATLSDVSGGIFLSDDAGLSFVCINPGLYVNKPCRDLQVVHIGETHRLYASVHSRILYTDDGGKRWTNLGAPTNNGFLGFWGAGVQQFCVGKEEHNRIVTVCDFIISSSDGGITWNESYSISTINHTFKNRGLVNTSPQAILVNPNNKNHILLCENDIGMSQSLDGGNTWKSYREYFRTNFTDAPWDSFDITMHNGVFYAMMGRRVKNFSWLMKSQDAEVWSAMKKFGQYGAKIVVVKNGTKTRLLVSVTGEGIYKSDEPFSDWKLEAIGNAAPIDITKDSNDVVYAALRYWKSNPGGIYKSSDKGDSWTALSNGKWFKDPKCVAINPVDPKCIMVGTSGYQVYGKGGLFKSADGGLTWRKLDNSISIYHENKLKRRISAICFNSNGSMLFVGFDDAASMDYNMDKGLYVSSDHGESFKKIDGLPSNRINCLAVDPFDLNSIYVGVEGGGVLKVTLPSSLKSPNIFIVSDNFFGRE